MTTELETELEAETAIESQKPEDGFLAFLLLLGQQEDFAVDLPAFQDALVTAQVLRRCVADGHMAGTERWSVLDVAAHIGLCTGKGRMPAERVRNGSGTGWCRLMPNSFGVQGRLEPHSAHIATPRYLLHPN